MNYLMTRFRGPQFITEFVTIISEALGRALLDESPTSMKAIDIHTWRV